MVINNKQKRIPGIPKRFVNGRSSKKFNVVDRNTMTVSIDILIIIKAIVHIWIIFVVMVTSTPLTDEKRGQISP